MRLRASGRMLCMIDCVATITACCPPIRATVPTVRPMIVEPVANIRSQAASSNTTPLVMRRWSWPTARHRYQGDADDCESAWKSTIPTPSAPPSRPSSVLACSPAIPRPAAPCSARSRFVMPRGELIASSGRRNPLLPHWRSSRNNPCLHESNRQRTEPDAGFIAFIEAVQCEAQRGRGAPPEMLSRQKL